MKKFSKILTKTDIRKRLSVRTKKKECFLNFGDKYKVEFKVIDQKGIVWPFECSKREKGKYPKPVLSKGWLAFVREWQLAVGDEVIFHEELDKAGQCFYRIQVIKTTTNQSPVPNHDAFEPTGVASSGDLEEDPSATMNSGVTTDDDPAIDDQSEGVRGQPVTGNMVGFMFGFGSEEPGVEVREPQFIDFFEREKERPSPTFIQFF
ncbi:hypothetical protein CCACVL1_16277 [Corchorus capsularis]|uniref:TF-B3 domain-containing protein n=1 Tax=Corchorus capsularis TaxID=210143 RepID=A0A1R3HY02_COCAP|nr:hypothetical protein CCACVL1_16277 [Corchorus capsularis]